MNGDGLPDLVSKEGDYLYVKVNTGAGFGQKVRWGQTLSGQELSSTKSYSFGAGAYMTWTINILFTPISIIINPGGDVSKSAGRRKSALLDINGDGLSDHVASTSDEWVSVALNRTGVTNKLKSVKRPLGAEFELEYALAGNTYDLPQSKWVSLQSETAIPGTEWTPRR